MTTALERVTNALDARGCRGRGSSRQCPSHDDRTASLRVTAEADRVLLHCHAGCKAEAVVAALGLPLSDLFDEPRNASDPEAVFDYRDEQAQLLYQVVRLPGKQFRQRRPDGDGWAWQLKGCRRVLYRLPELIAADPARWVFVPEGEKHVDDLIHRGLIATTNSGGADSWRPEYAASLKGRRVALLADNDGPGRTRVKAAAASLVGVAAEVRVVELPDLPSKGDILDWFEAGHKATELRKLVEAAPGLVESAAAKAAGLGVWLEDVTAESIEWLWPGYIALGVVTVVDGDPGLGKSTMTLDLAARVSTGRQMPDGSASVHGGVVILSAEDHLAKVIRPRLDAIDADLNRILALEVVPADDGGERDVEIPADLQYIEQAIVKAAAVLVVVDPLVAFLGAEVNSHRDQDVRRVLRRLKALAERLGVAIVVIRHLNKAAGGNPLYRGGGSIGIIGAARGGLLVAPDPDVEGRVVLACQKSNLAVMPPSQAFHIAGASNGAGTVQWDGASTHTSAALLAATQVGSQGSVRHDGEDFLKAILAVGPRPTVEVEDEAADLGISIRTLERVRKSLGVISFRVRAPGAELGSGGRWFLRLPGSAQAAKAATAPTLRNLAALDDSEYKPRTGGVKVGGLSGFGDADGEHFNRAETAEEIEEALSGRKMSWRAVPDELAEENAVAAENDQPAWLTAPTMVEALKSFPWGEPS